MTAPDVSVVTERLPGSQVGLTIEIPSQQVDKAYERVIQRLSQRVKIEGFRPGRAPRSLIETRVGPAAIREGLVEVLVSPAVDQALRERSIEAIDRPEVEIQDLQRGRTARFIARVSVKPDVALPDLDSLSVERTHTTVDEEMVQHRLDELREQLAQIEPVDRKVMTGDIVIGDLEVIADGEKVPSETRRAMEVEVREGVLLPELLGILPGRAVGEQVSAEITLPEDHSNAALRGKPAALRFTVQGVKEKRVPELTDELAGELSGGEQTTVEALRQAVREDLEEHARRYDELTFEQSALKAVVDASHFEVPGTLVEREVDRQLEELAHRLRHRGLLLERYLQHLNKSEEQYRAELRPDAESRIRVDLVMDALGKAMAISPSEDEVTEHMRGEAARDEELKRDLEAMLASRSVRDYFRRRLTRLHVLKGLVGRLGDPVAVVAERPGKTAE